MILSVLINEYVHYTEVKASINLMRRNKFYSVEPIVHSSTYDEYDEKEPENDPNVFYQDHVAKPSCSSPHIQPLKIVRGPPKSSTGNNALENELKGRYAMIYRAMSPFKIPAFDGDDAFPFRIEESPEFVSLYAFFIASAVSNKTVFNSVTVEITNSYILY